MTQDDIVAFWEWKKSKSAKSKDGRTGKKEPTGVTPRKRRVYLLHQLGWSYRQISQAYDICTKTVERWIKVVEKKPDWLIEEMPSLRLAKDRMEAMIPDAVSIYEDRIGDPEHPEAFAAATGLMRTYKILRDRKELEVVDDDGNISDEQLVAEAERIIASRKTKAHPDQSDA